jgi:predicted enzyme related to lactoylglutathione lyase
MKVKVGVSFYYVGDLKAAVEAYSSLLGTNPSYADDDWARFDLEGSALALHLHPELPRTKTPQAVRYGAIVSLTVEDIRAFLQAAEDSGFNVVGGIQDLPHGLQAEIRDAWGNRLSVLQPKRE